MTRQLSWHPLRQTILPLILIVLLLSACSAIRLGYNQADHVALWKADDYFDLDPRQKQEFLARFDRLYQWHRHEQLPEYASFLAAARRRIENGLGREDVIWFVEGLKTRYRVIANRGAEDAAALLSTLAPAQLAALRRQLDKDNRKFARENRLEDSVREQKRARSERTLKQIRDWTGSLSYEQEQKITAMLDDLPMIDQLRLADRLRRQRELLRLLELRGSGAAFTEKLRHWLVDWEEGRSPEYDRLLAHWWEQRVRFFVEVERMLTPHQRANLVHRLQDYIDDCRELSSQPGQRAAATS